MKCPRCQYELKPDSFSSEVVCTNCEFSAGPLDSSQADPAQLIAARDWDALIGDADHPGLLTDLRFIEAQCKWGREQVLLDHYNRALDAAPKFSREEEEPEPGETEEEDKIIITRPQAERLRAFEGFVSSHDRLLTEIPQDTVPFAFNYSEDGPVAAAAKILLPTHEGRWLKRSGRSASLGSFLHASTSNDGRRAIVMHEHDKPFRVWDLERGECVHTLNKAEGSNPFASISGDGRRAISTTEGGDSVRVWDLERRLCLHALTAAEISYGCASVSNDGKRAILKKRDGTLDVWDLQRGSRLSSIEGQEGVTCVAIGPDCRRAITGRDDGTLGVWSLRTGRRLDTFQCHGDSVTCVDISPDGRFVVLGRHNGTLGVKDLKTDNDVREKKGHRDPVTCVRISPDGRLAVSGSTDNTVRVWDLEYGSCLAVCHSVERVGFVAFLGPAKPEPDEPPAYGDVVVGTKDGNVRFLTPVGFPPCGPTILTVFEDRPARCPHCALRFEEPLYEVFLSHPVESAQKPQTFNETGLQTKCPCCKRPLKFNPFFIPTGG